jgi:phosphatidylglycerophosphate synthase
MKAVIVDPSTRRICGVPLLVRTLRSLENSGVTEVLLTGSIANVGDRFKGVTISRLNENCALDHDHFLLLNGDHLFDPRIIASSSSQEAPVLYVEKTSNPANVAVDGSRVTAVGKINEPETGYEWIGIATVDRATIQTLAENGELGLEESLDNLARSRNVHWKSVTELETYAREMPRPEIKPYWFPTDSATSRRRAEDALLTQLRGKPHDGPVSRWLNRPLSTTISRWLVRTSITPNQISLLSFLCCAAAASLFAFSAYQSWPIAYALLAFGGVLAQFGSVIDGCDGEVARLKFQQSDFGGWFDAVLDRYADALLVSAMTWRVLIVGDPLLNRIAPPGTPVVEAAIFLTGILALVGTFMVSYTADKYDGLMSGRIHRHQGFRIGRDLRIFLIFLAAVCNQLSVALLLIAVVMNLETIRRVWICQRSVDPRRD